MGLSTLFLRLFFAATLGFESADLGFAGSGVYMACIWPEQTFRKLFFVLGIDYGARWCETMDNDWRQYSHHRNVRTIEMSETVYEFYARGRPIADPEHCGGCGKDGLDDVEERYSHGVYAGKLCTKCCYRYRDHCGVDDDEQGSPNEMIESGETYWEE